jgi:hypothetical protein
MERYSQFFQDIFALTTAKNNFYLEVGAWKPEHYSNTYLLEKAGWRGFSLELEKDKKPLWDNHPTRKNNVYWTDALQFDYIAALKEQDMPMHLGYLSCDIEPPENTFAALKRIIEAGISFDCITFEHDRYRNDINYDPIATEFLLSYGYKVAVKNVYRNKKHRVAGVKKKIITQCYLETWYVSKDIAFDEMDFNEWIKRNGIT